ncbi:MAG: hypothetical protein V3R76_05245 [Gammaproteobacteria bacterium]
MTDTDPSKRFIACGMYAFTDDLRTAWQTLFDHFFQYYESPYPFEPVLRFDTGEKLMRDSHLLIGQTCGLPFVIPHAISSRFDKDHVTACLNEATLKMPDQFRQHLRLQGFERVDMDEYQGVLDLEKHARQAGYLHLN